MNAVFAAAGKLTPLSSRSHIGFRFLLPEAAPELEILFTYRPESLGDCDRSRELVAEALARYGAEVAEKAAADWRCCLPLNNLVTLSLDSPFGFRGAAHRRAGAQAVRISRLEATPGFLPGPIEAGFWSVTLSVHAVVTESCSYELEVRA